MHVPVRFPFTEPCGMCYFVHESFKQTGRKMTPQNLIFRFFPSLGGELDLYGKTGSFKNFHLGSIKHV